MNRGLLEAKLGRRIKTESGEHVLESAEQIIDRVSATLGAVELRYGATEQAARRWADRWRAMMTSNRFWPSGRILNNCGSRQGQLASCFVLPLSDDFSAIFDTLKTAAACHRAGGGTGFDLSPLRERGAAISTVESAGSSGAVSWLRLFDMETAVVAAGGKMRGANLAAISVRHPDILDFIDAKRTVGNLANFNLSVSIDDDFMRGLQADQSIDLISPFDGGVTQQIPARLIWERVCENAWRTGDPGLLFVDAINRGNELLDYLGPIRTTNPCGEQTLYPYEASNLGSLNLAAFHDPDSADVDWPALSEAATDAVRLLDNAIDASNYPDPRITKMAQENRRLGLGVMGFADLLVKMGIPYDSEAALQVIDKLGSTIHDAAWAASRDLADQRGPFINWSHTNMTVPVRNCAITTIAPTGTISMVAACSSGIEPRFAAGWNKDVLHPEGINHVDDDLVMDLETHGRVSRAQATALVLTKPIAELPLPDSVRAKYRYAHDVSAEWHVRTLARWQRYVDNGVSKTINMPSGCAPADIGAAYELAWSSGCKGVSVYRQGSRDRDLLAVNAATHVEPERQSKQLLAAAASLGRARPALP